MTLRDKIAQVVEFHDSTVGECACIGPVSNVDGDYRREWWLHVADAVLEAISEPVHRNLHLVRDAVADDE